MEHKDEENSEKPTVEDEAAAGSPAQPDVFTNGRILVKLRLPRMTDEMEEEEEEEEKMAEAAAEIYPPADQERKSHYCKECNKSFSCGKALGGHMSSAHVQANKDYSYRKLSSKMKRQHKDSGSAAAEEDNTCKLCGKVFRSKKSLFGHMRCHPERDWRGMEPPPRTELKIDSLEASSEPESEDAGQNQETEEEEEEEEEDDQIDSGSDIGARTGSDLKGWPTAAKRGRGPVIPATRASVSSSEEKETFVAGHQLIRLLKGESGARQGPESGSGNLSKKQKLDSGAQKLKIHERDAAIDEAAQLRRKTGKEKLDAKGKAKADETSTMSLPDDIDSDDELYLTAIEVLVNGKRDQIENQKRVVEEEKMDVRKLTSPEKYICNICNRSFPTHQALGGHRSSHNKFKLSIVNTADRRAKTAKERTQSKKDPNAKSVASNAADDHSETAEKVVLDFDLNMMPEEGEGKDVDGDSSNHTSNS